MLYQYTYKGPTMWCDGSLQVEMTGSSILDYVHRLDQQELVQQFHLQTPPTSMTSSQTHLYYSDDECADDNRTTRSSLSNGLLSLFNKDAVQCHIIIVIIIFCIIFPFFSILSFLTNKGSHLCRWEFSANRGVPVRTHQVDACQTWSSSQVGRISGTIQQHLDSSLIA